MKKIDPALKIVLQDFSRSYLSQRLNAFTGLDFENLRDKLASIKDQALEQNEKLLAEFEKNARNHGSQVLWAEDSQEANELVFEILHTLGAKKLVKSKSMVSEETGLNEFLSERGIEARETDLGEWIVQLAREKPSHMVMPAIHLTRKDVQRIFSRKLGKEVPDEISELVHMARQELRQEILSAQAGLTGANALIADTGSIMLVTNEGNGRLVSATPPVHIVLTSIEKVLPSIDEALVLLKVLPRNATGQTITSYVSFMAGPPRKAQYIILVDNRRLKLLRDPVFREVLRCVKCSACLNVCPVYQIVSGKEFSHVYMGGIGSLLTAWIHGLKHSKKLAEICLGCHRCDDFCATKIRIADLIMVLKEKLNEELGRPFWKRVAFEKIMANRILYQTILKAARKARPVIIQKEEFSRKLPLILKKYDRFRSLPVPAIKPFSRLFSENFHEKIKEEQKQKEKQRKTITIFAGCLVENFYPEIGMAAAKALSRLGCEVRIAPPACCGFPSSNAGFASASKKIFQDLFEKIKDAEIIITLCPTCTTMLARTGPQVLGSEEAKELAKRVYPFGLFIAEKYMKKIAKLSSSKFLFEKVTYHDSCHHKYLFKASDASRRLIERALGTKILEMENSDLCCGFAGTFSLEHPEISEALLEDKLASIKKTGARIVALDCPGCLLQIRGACHCQALDIQVAHTAELIEKSFKISHLPASISASNVYFSKQ